MIFLSFDIEEFDNPFPCSQQLSFEQQMEISVKGTHRILDLLALHHITATFFCTVNFTSHAFEADSHLHHLLGEFRYPEIFFAYPKIIRL